MLVYHAVTLAFSLSGARTAVRDASSVRMAADVPSIIVGGGRIGNALKDIGVDGDVLLKRGEPIPATPSSGPIYVCTRNDDLAAIVAGTPADRRADLVFMQNGILTGFLESEGLAGNTQVLLYLAVAKLGEKPTDGITEFNPEGLTAAKGKWADTFAARLAKGDLACRALDGDDYTAAMLEKHVRRSRGRARARSPGLGPSGPSARPSPQTPTLALALA